MRKACESCDCSAWRREGSRGSHQCAQILMWESKDDWTRRCLEMSSEKTRSKLKHGRFCSNTRKKKSLWRLLDTGTSCPERLRSLHSQRHAKPGWTSPEQPALAIWRQCPKVPSSLQDFPVLWFHSSSKQNWRCWGRQNGRRGAKRASDNENETFKSPCLPLHWCKAGQPQGAQGSCTAAASRADGALKD